MHSYLVKKEYSNQIGSKISTNIFSREQELYTPKYHVANKKLTICPSESIFKQTKPSSKIHCCYQKSSFVIPHSITDASLLQLTYWPMTDKDINYTVWTFVVFLYQGHYKKTLSTNECKSHFHMNIFLPDLIFIRHSKDCFENAFMSFVSFHINLL